MKYQNNEISENLRDGNCPFRLILYHGLRPRESRNSSSSCFSVVLTQLFFICLVKAHQLSAPIQRNIREGNKKQNKTQTKKSCLFLQR